MDNSSITAIKVHGIAVFLLAFSRLFTDDPAALLIIGSIVCTPTYAYLAYREARRSPLYISPLSFYFAWYTVGLGISPLLVASKIRSGEPIFFSIEVVPYYNIALGFLFFAIGSFCLHVGVQMTAPRFGIKRQTFEGTRAMSILLIGVWVTGMAVRVLPHSITAIGALRGLLYWGSTAALTVYALQNRRRNATFWAIFITGLLFELASNIPSGSKAYIMFSFLPLVWLLALRSHLRKYLVPAGVSLAILYLAVVAPTVKAARRWMLYTGQAELSVATFVSSSEASADSLQENARAFLDRQFDPVAIALISRHTASFGFLNGRGLDYLAYSFIPRVLWPGKPNVTRGAWFTMYMGFAQSEQTATTSTGQTAAGELYFNFGLPGVVLGMFGLGLFVGKLWSIAGHRPDENPLRMLLYLLLTIGIADMPEAGTVLVACVQRLIFFSFALWYFEAVARGTMQSPLPKTA